MIAEGKHSIEAVCIESGMSILELAEHVCTPRNLEALARVARLHAIEREMLLEKLKRKALLRLAELTDEVPAANADEIRAAEVMRKACADLLRYRGLDKEKSHSRPEDPGGGYHPEPLTPASEAEILEALERLGQEDGEEEVYPQIEDLPSCPPRRGRITQMRHEENRNEPRARTSGSVEGGDAGCFNETARDDGDRGNLSPIPHGHTLKTPLVHAARNQPHQPRPPPYLPH